MPVKSIMIMAMKPVEIEWCQALLATHLCPWLLLRMLELSFCVVNNSRVVQVEHTVDTYLRVAEQGSQLATNC